MAYDFQRSFSIFVTFGKQNENNFLFNLCCKTHAVRDRVYYFEWGF